jgi:short-subunit dehydrogenase
MNATPKTALVTGGSDGLGRCVAGLLAQRGYVLTIIGRDPVKLESVIQRLPGANHTALALDLSMPDGTTGVVRLLNEERFRILVNNAGGTRFGALSSLEEDSVERYLRLNLVTPVALSRAFLKRASPGDVLVNVTSIVGTIPIPGNALYSAAKSGLQSMTECLWYEMKQKGVRVIDFRPVSLDTGFHRRSGGVSMSAPGTTITPDSAAVRLVHAIEGGRDFVCVSGTFAVVLECLRRILPKRMLIGIMGRRSEKAGYLDSSR